jgi:hypothetical protein
VTTPTFQCPICKKAVRPRADNPAFPFCSSRCKQVDLGQWFDEKYRLPAEEELSDESTGADEKPS